MNIISKIKKELFNAIQKLFGLDLDQMNSVEINLNVDKEKSFGDLTCNAAMVFAKALKKNPKDLALQISEFLLKNDSKNFPTLKKYLADVQVAGPGFLNVFFKDQIWQDIAEELFIQKDNYFKLDESEKKLKYLVEFVSANPTGPLHLGHGRGGIIGDVLANVLRFLGHDATKEFYINDAGSQIQKLGLSFRARCQQELGIDAQLPEGGYQGGYLIDLAKECVKTHGKDLLKNEDEFFSNYAKEKLLENIKHDLNDYGINFDVWFSEKSLHDKGHVEQILKLLQSKDLVYEKDGAFWFRSTNFGDDKDRVVKKQDGELTYIAADIAYHKDKFDRGFNKLIDVLGQDHHGYVTRLKATVQSLGFNSKNLDVILYQLVSIRNKDVAVKMSKRAGTFTTLREIIDTVGKDVARFFYLNRKAEAHLEFDLSVALKKTEENPVFYIQYAFVRTKGILTKAAEVEDLKNYIQNLNQNKLSKKLVEQILQSIGQPEFDLIKQIISLQDILRVIANNYQTHLLAYYSWELAHVFHNYYSNNRIINEENIPLTQARLLMIMIVRNTLQTCLTLLGVSSPERM